MSGSNCICVVTALLESGRLPMKEPETTVRLDTPAGLIVARARCENDRCIGVSLDNVPSFAELLDREVDTPEWGTH
jgi:proline racemase